MIALWILSTLGLTWIVNRSFFMAGLRRFIPKPEGETPFFGILIRCAQCFGLWSGVLHAGAYFLEAAFPKIHVPVTIALAGFAASFLGYSANVVLNKLGQGPIEEYLPAYVQWKYRKNRIANTGIYLMRRTRTRRKRRAIGNVAHVAWPSPWQRITPTRRR